ncbi:hypothetical protein J5A66_03740 [Prevotella sp. oral taxon 475]|uniref:hypothetical protein n=1 Tax=Prevotella sp. oral taxon 475 TaxID=712471 RepID=UPI001BA8238E|nr:hypothetical protein [Prevotella sp. oral taxon 475]QUB47917.1 hypothetical protein J5A66_03740 [Prevotella sp. oral taxon 475]
MASRCTRVLYDVRETTSCGVNDVRAQSTKYSFVNNRIAVGLLAGQGWRVKRAYPVYDVKRENKAVGLGLFNSLK